MSDQMPTVHAFTSQKGLEICGQKTLPVRIRVSDGTRVASLAVYASRELGESSYLWDDREYLGEVEDHIVGCLPNLHYNELMHKSEAIREVFRDEQPDSPSEGSFLQNLLNLTPEQERNLQECLAEFKKTGLGDE